jgi:hypothetical protein
MRHYKGRFDYYCVMTIILNPILKIIFFQEMLVKLLQVDNVHPVQRILSDNTLATNE